MLTMMGDCLLQKTSYDNDEDGIKVGLMKERKNTFNKFFFRGSSRNDNTKDGP